MLNICHLFLDGSDRAFEQVRARDLANAGARLQQVDPSAQIGGHFMQADHTSAFVSGGPYHGRQVFEGGAQSSQDQEHVAHMAVKGGPYKDVPYNHEDMPRASAFHDAVGQAYDNASDCPGLQDSSSNEDRERQVRERQVREPREPTMQEYQTTKLRVVDPITDEGVWAIVDDACNSSCHGRSWRLNAEEKWKMKGFNSFVRSSKPTTFKGVGNAQTAGKLHVPFATKLVESGMIIPGGMDSHELPTADHPMLISQSVQARLGMIKCIRNGIIWLQDYDNQTLEVVRHYKTGLFMIRIDHLLVDDYKKLKSKTGKFLNKLVIGHVDGSSTEESSGSERLLYSSQSADRRQFIQDAAHVHIVTVNTVPINKAEFLDYYDSVQCRCAEF